MRTLRTVGELRAALAGRRAHGRTVALVPTMGALHEGHLSLIRRARAECDVVVVSLFVNPTQFTQPADLASYPRDEARDRGLASDAGADLLFAPSAQEMYPPGFATTVSVQGVTAVLEGAARGEHHFHGVTTVVTKLLIAGAPDALYLGQKDIQQTVVLRRLICDLGLAVRVVVCPTVRELDGLALSSRNTRLGAPERQAAVALWRALAAAARSVEQGERDGGALMRDARGAMAVFDVVPEYLQLVAPATLAPVGELDEPALLVVAATVGEVRLIDNLLLVPSLAAPVRTVPFPQVKETAQQPCNA